MIGVLITSFKLEEQFILISATAIAIPFILGDIVVLVFCTVWYPRPVPKVGYWVLGTDVVFVLASIAWLVLGCLIVHRNIQRAGNRAHDHAHTTKIMNELTTIETNNP
jgi:hypothetical protein